MGRKKSNPKSVEEKKRYEREKKRKQRARMTDEQKELKKKRDREYKNKRKEENTWKTVETMSDRELRKVRKQTKLRVRRFRERKAAEARLTNMLNQTTPPQSPQENQIEFPLHRLASSRQSCGRKKKNLNRSRVYRTLMATQLALKKEKTRAERFKKQAQRLRERLREKGSPSPNSKIKKLARGQKVPSPIKRRLAFAEVVLSELEKKKKAMSGKREKEEFNKIVSSPSLKKHKLIKEASFMLSYKTYRRALMRQNCKPIKRNHEHAKLIKLFLEEDINSRMCPGKKDTRTLNKVKKQKRLLLDTMKNLHGKFKKSFPGLNISYSKFCSLKPFYIVQPKTSDRETCACIKHVNAQFVVDKLYQLNVIYTNSINKILEDSCCSIESKQCMYRKCIDCSTKLEFDLKGKENLRVTFKQWIQKKETRVIKEKDTIVKITEKAQRECSLKELLENLVTRLHDLGPHIYQIHQHYKVMKNLRQSMGENEVIIHMDFSENYVIKHAEEVQSMHFGASKKQLSLHTLVCYSDRLGNTTSDTITTKGVKSFATISSNLDHQAHGVWAHLEPIITYLRESLPEVDTVHFRSDGPSSQYKNKSNVFFLHQCFPSLWPEIFRWSWNFSISGHGKGPMDGIGGTLKRTADAMVLRGQDITNTTDFIKIAEANCTKIKVIEVENYKFKEWKNKLNDVKLQKIPGIFQVHQMLWTKDDPMKLQLRELPCSECKFKMCHHHPVGKKNYLDLSYSTDNYAAPEINAQEDETIENMSDHGLVTSDVANAQIGSYVAVIYDTTWFPGEVMDIKEDEATIKFMARNGKNFQWPAKPDVQQVKVHSILCIINKKPHQVSSRNFVLKCTDEVDKQCSAELDEA